MKSLRGKITYFAVAILSLVNHAEVTSRAFLIAAESSFEVLFGQMARVVYEKNPQALPKSDHAFTFEELASYNSISDARDALLTRKIESLLRESPEEWSKWLKRTTGLTMDEIMPTWPQVREIFIRRNMLVHTDGNVTGRYLAEVKRSGGSVSHLKVGQSLIPTVEYLQTALQRLIALETLLVCKVVSHIDKQQADAAAKWLASRLEWVIRKEMSDAACLIADSFNNAHCMRTTQLTIQVNGWLAHKNRDGMNSVITEVNAWDVSGLSKKYHVLKKALLNRLTGEEVIGFVSEGIFSRLEVLMDPIFHEVRDFVPSQITTSGTERSGSNS